MILQKSQKAFFYEASAQKKKFFNILTASPHCHLCFRTQIIALISLFLLLASRVHCDDDREQRKTIFFCFSVSPSRLENEEDKKNSIFCQIIPPRWNDEGKQWNVTMNNEYESE